MKTTQTFAMIMMLSAAAGFANAQATTSSDDQDLLRGPAVTDNSSVDKENNAMDEVSVEEELAARPMQLSEFFGAIKVLSSSNDGNLLNLTADQQDKIKDIQQTQREEFAAFREENYVQFRTLRDQMNKELKERRERRKKEAENKDAMQDSMQSTEEGDEKKNAERPKEGDAAKQLRELVENAPPTLKAKQSLEDLLSESQFQLVQERAVKTRMRQKENRERRMKADRERDTAKRGADREKITPTEERRDGKRKGRDNADD